MHGEFDLARPQYSCNLGFVHRKYRDCSSYSLDQYIRVNPANPVSIPIGIEGGFRPIQSLSSGLSSIDLYHTVNLLLSLLSTVRTSYAPQVTDPL